MKATFTDLMDKSRADSRIFVKTVITVYGHEDDDFYSVKIHQSGDKNSVTLTPFDASGNRLQEPVLMTFENGAWNGDCDIDNINRKFLIE